MAASYIDNLRSRLEEKIWFKNEPISVLANVRFKKCIKSMLGGHYCDQIGQKFDTLAIF